MLYFANAILLCTKEVENMRKMPLLTCGDVLSPLSVFAPRNLSWTLELDLINDL